MQRYRELELNLSEEHEALRDTVRKFGAEVVRPAGIALDRYTDPADAIAEGSELWEVFRRYQELGLHKLHLSPAVGGMAQELDAMGRYVVGEELGYADGGLAISLEVSSMPFALAANMPVPALQDMARRYCEDTRGEMVGCWAITEPDHGTDWYLGKGDPRCGASVKAVLDGDCYVVNGEKAAWVSNGTIATHAVLHVGLQPEKGMEGTGLAILPLDLPGIDKAKPLDKMGQRALNQGSIVFQDARVPKEYVVVADPAIMQGMLQPLIAAVNGGMSIVFAGLARAIFDEALAYAQERIQGGVPIFEHKNVKSELFQMFMRVEAARAQAMRTALFNAAPPDGQPSAPHAVSAKVFSTETATFVADRAIQIFGGNVLSKEYPIEKMFRDARTSMVEDGVNETLGIAAIEFLRDQLYSPR